MKSWLRLVIAIAVSSFLLGVVVKPGATTLAAFSDTERADGFMRLTAVVAPPCLGIWANSTTLPRTFEVAGTNLRVFGCVHSNNNITLTSGGWQFSGPVRYVTSVQSGTIPGAQQVPVRAQPFPFNASHYAPGGCKAVAAGTNYHFSATDLTLTKGQVTKRLYYVNGNATFDLEGHTANVTVVATGKVTLDTKKDDVIRPHVDGLLAFSTRQNGDGIEIHGNGNKATLYGHIHAPAANVSFTGHNNNYTGQITGSVVRIASNGNHFHPLAVGDVAACPGSGASTSGAQIVAPGTPSGFLVGIIELMRACWAEPATCANRAEADS